MRRTCSTESCGSEVMARGLCSKHYQAAKRNGVLEQLTPNPAGPCAHCGGDTLSRRWGAKFCSVGCKQAAADEAARQETRQRHMRRVKQCAWCLSNLVSSTRASARFCSKTCSVDWGNHQAKTMRRKAILAARRPCARCGDPIPESRARSAVYCGKSCKDASDLSDSPKAKRRRTGQNLRLYGLTIEQYEAMLSAQSGRCLICGAEEAGGKGRLHVDHCHSSGQIRGLLCHYCNLGLGHFKDDPAALERAAAYLRAVSVAV